MSHSQCPMVSGVRSLFRSTRRADPLGTEAERSERGSRALVYIAGVVILLQAVSGSAITLGGSTLSSTRARLLCALAGALTLVGGYCLACWERGRGDRPAGRRALGQYTLAEKLGEGGMGVVYKAHHPRFTRPMAIKVLHAEQASEQAVRRFEREVALTSRLTHPNTVTIYDSGRTRDGDLYYAMEYLEGVDLETLVEREGPLAPARVAHVLAELAAALAETHELGLIHRDIKPANVMLCPRGDAPDQVKLVDFGLSQELADPNTKHDDRDRVVGTPLYVSPEALLAPESMDGRSDLYSLGALGYFLLTGEPPFSGAGILEVCAQHLHVRPTPPSRRLGTPIPERLERLILRCLEKSMQERPGSAAELYEALGPLAGERSALRARAA